MGTARFAESGVQELAQDSPGNNQGILTESKIKQAMAWLREELKDGPRLAKEMDELAQAKGFTVTTLYKARRRAGVSSKRQNGHWVWTLASQRKHAARLHVVNA